MRWCRACDVRPSQRELDSNACDLCGGTLYDNNAGPAAAPVPAPEAPPPRPPRGRSVAVTVVGLGFVILGVGSVVAVPLAVVGFLERLRVGGMNFRQFLAAPFGIGLVVVGLGVVFATVAVFLGLFFLVVGVGVLRRRWWGRVLGMILAGLAVVNGVSAAVRPDPVPVRAAVAALAALGGLTVFVLTSRRGEFDGSAD